MGLCVCLSDSRLAIAQTIPRPDSGQLLPATQAPPPPSSSAPSVVVAPPVEPAPPKLPEARLVVSSISVSGNTVFSEPELLALVADALKSKVETKRGITGTPLSFAELQALADRITAHYRTRGYLLAQAYLPAQEIVQGQVRIAVLEGRISRVNLSNESRHTEGTVKSPLANVPIDTPLYNPTLERGLLLLSDLPGSSVQATLKPGASVGTSELDIQVKDKQLVSGDISLDNQGNRYTGEYRLGAGLKLNSPLRLGDTLDLRLIGAGKGFNYGRLAWQMPLGASDLQVGIAGSAMNYSLQKNFANLQAHGGANTASAYALYPLIRSRFTNLNAQLTYERKNLDDRVDITASVATKTLGSTQIGLSGSRYDNFGGGGLNIGAITLVTGQLSLDAAAQLIDAAGLRTQGSYNKTLLQLARTQRLSDQWNLHGQINGQVASKNLDNAEKLSLGGSQTVRAYPQGEAPVDDGWLTTIEVRYSPSPPWQLALFHDSAQGKLQNSPQAITGNERRLSGSGIGITYTHANGLNMQASLAWRDGDAPTSDSDLSPRGWLRLLQPF